MKCIISFLVVVVSTVNILNGAKITGPVLEASGITTPNTSQSFNSQVFVSEPLKKLPESPKSKKLSSPKQPIETEKYNSSNGTSHAYPVQSKPGILNKESPKSKGFPSEKASFRIRRKSVAHAHSSNKAGNIFEKIMSKIHKHM